LCNKSTSFYAFIYLVVLAIPLEFFLMRFPLLGNFLIWLAPLLENYLVVLKNMAKFEVHFAIAFGDDNEKRLVETKIQSLHQTSPSTTIYVVEFEQHTYRIVKLTD
jgi:hypothetical protein